MRPLKQDRHHISGLFVFLLLGIFALSGAVLVLIGSQVYKGSADRTAAHNQDRIAAAYIRSKLREADDRGMLSAESLDGADHLEIDNDEEGTVTILYVKDGMLHEWYTLKQLTQTADIGQWGGEPVCELDAMEFSVDGNLVTAQLQCGESQRSVQQTIRSFERGADNVGSAVAEGTDADASAAANPVVSVTAAGEDVAASPEALSAGAPENTEASAAAFSANMDNASDAEAAEESAATTSEQGGDQ